MRFLDNFILGLVVAANLANGAAVERRDLASTILAEIESAATCVGCGVRKNMSFCRPFSSASDRLESKNLTANAEAESIVLFFFFFLF